MRYAYATANWIYKLKGYSKKITQLVENGNFANGLTNWNNTISTYSLNNNELSFTPTEKYGGITNTVGTFVQTGDKLLYLIEIKANKNCIVYLGGRVSPDYTSRLVNGDYNYSVSTSYKKIALIITATESIKQYIAISQNMSSDFPIYTIRQFQCFNLTKDFGAGNEPTTVAQCEAYYGNKYIPYGEQILNCKMPIVAHGKNLIDITKFVLGRVEGSGKITTEKDYPIGEILSTTNDGITFRIDRSWHGVISDFCKVTPNKTYYIKYNCTTPYSENVVYGFDKDKNFVSRLAVRYTNPQEYPIIVPAGNIEYLIFSNQYEITGEKYLSNIQLEEGSTATNYEPYYSKTIDCGRDLLFNDTLSTDGKVDIGSGKVDLGTATWRKGNNNRFRSDITLNKIKPYTNYWVACPYIYCSKYNTQSASVLESATPQTGIGIGGDTVTTVIYDSALADLTESAFKTALNGVILDYELATHAASTFTPVPLQNNLTFVDDNGYKVEIVESNFEVKKWKSVIKSRNLFDISKVVSRSGVVQNNNNGTITVYTYPSEIGILKDICPNIKAGDSVVISIVSEGIHTAYLYNSRRYLSPDRPTVINEEDLNGRVGMYAERVDGGYKPTIISNIQIEKSNTPTSYEPYGLKFYLPTTRLPLEYQEVKYLESTGTQYIDTGYIPNNKTKFTIKNAIMVDGSASALAGHGLGSGFGNSRCIIGTSSQGNHIVYYGIYNLNYEGVSQTFQYEKGVPFIASINLSKPSYSFNGVEKNASTSRPQATGSIYLFARHNTTALPTDMKAPQRLYFANIEEDTMVKEFIPCYRRSDHKPGMYDIVNNVFHTNQGQGEFILGEEI